MNKAIKYILVAAAGVLLSGCSEDFFTKTPQNTLDASKIDERLVDSYRNSVYGYMGGAWGNSSAPFLDGYVDNGYSRNNWDSNGSAVQSNTLNAALGFGYDYDYQGVRACNKVISDLDNFENVSQNIREKYKNESKVIRAWLYTELTLFYGDVILIDEAENDYPEGLKRTPAAEVRAWILKELDEAIAGLPETNNPGYLNKTMALAIKARAAYYFGNYKEAEIAARKVIDSGKYALHTAPELTPDMLKDAEFFKALIDDPSVDKDKFIRGLFNYQDIWKADNSTETIIAEEFIASEQYGDFYRVTALMAPNQVTKQAWATIVPIQELVDAYWMVDGKTLPTLTDRETRKTSYINLDNAMNDVIAEEEVSFSEAVSKNMDQVLDSEFIKQFKNRDTRLYASICFPFSSISRFRDGEYQPYIADIVNYGRSGYTFRKMAGADDVASVWDDKYYLSGVDYPVIRLAEMMLIYAEAHTQTTGYDASVTAELNKLRVRAGMPNVPTGLSKNEALDFIRSERRIELAGEGHRFYDIRLYEDDTRNGGYKGIHAASAVMKGQVRDVAGNPGAELKWASRLMYMPLPTTALDKNKVTGLQNPGY